MAPALCAVHAGNRLGLLRPHARAGARRRTQPEDVQFFSRWVEASYRKNRGVQCNRAYAGARGARVSTRVDRGPADRDAAEARRRAAASQGADRSRLLARSRRAGDSLRHPFRGVGGVRGRVRLHPALLHGIRRANRPLGPLCGYVQALAPDRARGGNFGGLGRVARRADRLRNRVSRRCSGERQARPQGRRGSRRRRRIHGSGQTHARRGFACPWRVATRSGAAGEARQSRQGRPGSVLGRRRLRRRGRGGAGAPRNGVDVLLPETARGLRGRGRAPNAGNWDSSQFPAKYSVIGPGLGRADRGASQSGRARGIPMKTTTSSRPLTLVHDSIEAKLAPLKILVIDDQSTGRIVLSEIMRSLDASLEVATFSDPVEGIEYARKHPVDMVLTDYKMPTLDGIEVIRRLRRIFGYEDVPIVCITVVNDREVRYRALEAGATDFLIRPIDRLECGARCRNLLSLRRHEILKKNRTRILEQKIDEATRELRRREVETLFRLAKAAEQRDKVTGMHLVRMGYDMLKDSSSGYLQMAAVIALGHHEKYDGSGYPTGLRGEHIPLEARIVAIADVYDALTSVRPYKPAWPVEEALVYMVEHAGRHFDPQLVEILSRNRDEVLSIGERFADQVAQ